VFPNYQRVDNPEAATPGSKKLLGHSWTTSPATVVEIMHKALADDSDPHQDPRHVT
jgi:formate dehydrogenase major subunit